MEVIDRTQNGNEIGMLRSAASLPQPAGGRRSFLIGGATGVLRA
jgi:hypothetical protein